MQTNYQECALFILHIPVVGLYRLFCVIMASLLAYKHSAHPQVIPSQDLKTLERRIEQSSKIKKGKVKIKTAAL